jgi:DNA mismatch endonuclease (patch repair protein)
VVFVHGCFWHRHGCKLTRPVPQTNRAYWLAKFERNKKRDARQKAELRRLGWRVLTVWECQVGRNDLPKRLTRFLRGDAAHSPESGAKNRVARERRSATKR